ncbi:MAG: DUF58 domain-containing protein [Chthonomonadales bacterium]|nr:DUF58 domain-containing protein [Chthonomonadales bacterium]
MSTPLLAPSFLRKLERLALASRRAFAGQMKGENRAPRRGASVEFADYREYQPGDDLRYVDWNTAARLDRLFVKLFVEEEDVLLALLLDTSASMGFGEPAKLEVAIRVAAALGYVGLIQHDRVRVAAFPGAPGTAPAPRRGRAAVPPFFAHLAALRAEGGAPLGPALRDWAAASRGRGIAVVISDFMDTSWREGVGALVARDFQATLLHLLSPEELVPTVRGDVALIDSETRATLPLSVGPALLARYQAALAAHCDGIRAFARARGAGYLRVSTGATLEDIVLKQLRRAGVAV